MNRIETIKTLASQVDLWSNEDVRQYAYDRYHDELSELSSPTLEGMLISLRTREKNSSEENPLGVEQDKILFGECE